MGTWTVVRELHEKGFVGRTGMETPFSWLGVGNHCSKRLFNTRIPRIRGVHFQPPDTPHPQSDLVIWDRWVDKQSPNVPTVPKSIFAPTAYVFVCSGGSRAGAKCAARACPRVLLNSLPSLPYPLGDEVRWDQMQFAYHRQGRAQRGPPPTSGMFIVRTATHHRR